MKAQTLCHSVRGWTVKGLHTLLLAICFGPVVLYASEFPPLADSVIAAKKVALRDISTDTAGFDYLYRKLKKWGRWEIVANESEADLIIAFASEDKGLGSMGTVTPGSGTIFPVFTMPRTVIVLSRQSKPLMQVSCEQRILVSGTASCLVGKLKHRIERK